MVNSDLHFSAVSAQYQLPVHSVSVARTEHTNQTLPKCACCAYLYVHACMVAQETDSRWRMTDGEVNLMWRINRVLQLGCPAAGVL